MLLALAVAMSNTSLAFILDALRKYRLLEQRQLSALASSRFADPKALAKALLQRKWLTAYQATLLLQGKGYIQSG